MTPLAKLTLLGVAAGVAYWASRDVEVKNGIRHFTPEAQKRIKNMLFSTALANTDEPIPGEFAFKIVRGPDEEHPNTVKFLNATLASGNTVYMTEDAAKLAPGNVGLVSPVVITAPREEARDLAGDGGGMVLGDGRKFAVFMMV